MWYEILVFFSYAGSLDFVDFDAKRLISFVVKPWSNLENRLKIYL